MATLEELDKLEFLKLEGTERCNRRIIRVVGKLFPAVAFTNETLRTYILQKLKSFGVEASSGTSFVIVYFHTAVKSDANNPGLLTLTWLYETLPGKFKQKLEAVYFVHPGLHSRLLLGTLGRLLSERLYAKVKFLHRIEFLWAYIDSEQLQVPEFAREHDVHLEYRPYTDNGLDPNAVWSMPHPYCIT